MNLINEKQRTNISSESGFESLNVDCFVKQFSEADIILQVFPNQKTDFSEFEVGYEVDVKVFTPKGIVIFQSKVVKVISDKELEIYYDENSTKVEDTRKNPRYSANCPVTIFRPLLGNIDAKLMDISVRGIRFYSKVELESNSVFEIMLYLSDSIGKILLTGRILDKEGLPEGVHRMIIEEISYTDRQKLIDFCMSLAK